MDRDYHDYIFLSLRLSRVLDDVGASETLILKRRKTFLLRESMDTVIQRLLGNKATVYCFGSQTEASTTPGLKSDIDILVCLESGNIMQDTSEWRPGLNNFLAIKDASTPPRHRFLQVFRSDIPEPSFNLQRGCVRDEQSRILLCHSALEQDMRQLYRKEGFDEMIREGPSFSLSSGTDMVPALRFRSTPPEVETWIAKPRPGHWPMLETLTSARECGCFLLFVGYPGSPEYKKQFEWRLSPSLIERRLMFSLSVVHIKTYIFLKMIKSSIFKPCIGNGITSFHCKTVLWFTIENTPPGQWVEANLFQCVLSCLQTMNRFLKFGFCPHYIISDMNLFTAKLPRHDQHKLRQQISSMLASPFWLFAITTDGVGDRLRNMVVGPLNSEPDISRYDLHCETIATFTFQMSRSLVRGSRELLTRASNASLSPEHTCRSLVTYLERLQQTTSHGTREEIYIADLMIPHIKSTLATIQASLLTSRSQPISLECLGLFQMSLNTDVASSRLKLASALFCRKQYVYAAHLLQYVESIFDNDVRAVCGCGIEIEKEGCSRNFGDKAIRMELHQLHSQSVAFCVRFSRQEMWCVPDILRFDMFRTDRRALHPVLRNTAECVVVDSKPFLYYLKYMTSGALGLRNRQSKALRQLGRTFQYGNEIYHYETNGYLMGHCFEKENMPVLALLCYKLSLEYSKNKLLPTNT